MQKPIEEQVVVITGASSGIGRAAALRFADRGADVVLVARSGEALEEAAREIEWRGAKSHIVVADVASWEEVQRAAQEAVDAFGRIDTWVNNAAVATYGTVAETDVDEIQRVVQVNLMGQIHGMKAALPHLRAQGGGTIINVSSTLGKRAVPLQAPYVATKHAIKGFSEALRMEEEYHNTGVHVTTIFPSSINTPLFTHARAKIDAQPKPVPPIWDAEVAADAILFAAEHPRREISVGGQAAMTGLLQRISPKLLDWYMVQNGRLFKQQMADRPADTRDNLFEPMQGTGRITGEYSDQTISSSPYTRTFGLYPRRSRAILAAMLLGVAGLFIGIGRRTR